eukprot:759281-Hanusia_phi.AAC.1
MGKWGGWVGELRHPTARGSQKNHRCVCPEHPHPHPSDLAGVRSPEHRGGVAPSRSGLKILSDQTGSRNTLGL